MILRRRYAAYNKALNPISKCTMPFSRPIYPQPLSSAYPPTKHFHTTTTSMPINVTTPGSPMNSATGSHKTEGSDGISPGVPEQNGVDKTVNDKGNKITYVDPTADVSLVSLEGRIFKVESYVLKAHR